MMLILNEGGRVGVGLRSMIWVLGMQIIGGIVLAWGR
jgi:hypothetical protein